MIQQITYKGKEHPVRISYSVLRKLKANGYDFAKLDEGDMDIYMPLLLYALESGAKAEDKSCEFTLDDMEDVLDECFMDFVKSVPAFFQQWTEGVTMPTLPREVKRQMQRQKKK